jgi:hypothetical protein
VIGNGTGEPVAEGGLAGAEGQECHDRTEEVHALGLGLLFTSPAAPCHLGSRPRIFCISAGS